MCVQVGFSVSVNHAKKSLFFPVNLPLQMGDDFFHVPRVHLRAPQRVAGITADAFPLLVRAEKHFLHEQTKRRAVVPSLYSASAKNTFKSFISCSVRNFAPSFVMCSAVS